MSKGNVAMLAASGCGVLSVVLAANVHPIFWSLQILVAMWVTLALYGVYFSICRPEEYKGSWVEKWEPF